jgi:hypothetical protein
MKTDKEKGQKPFSLDTGQCGKSSLYVLFALSICYQDATQLVLETAMCYQRIFLSMA